MVSNGFPENPTSPDKDQFIAHGSGPSARDAKKETANMENRQGWTLIGAL